MLLSFQVSMIFVDICIYYPWADRQVNSHRRRSGGRGRGKLPWLSSWGKFSLPPLKIWPSWWYKEKNWKSMPRGGQKSCPGGEKIAQGGEFSRAQAQIILPSWPILVLCPCLQQFKAPVKNVKILKNSGTPGLRSVDRQARGLSRAPRPGRLGGRALWLGKLKYF